MKPTPSRRSFLRATAATAGAALLPSLLHGGGGRPADTIGHGAFTYRVDPRWGDLDARKQPVQHCHEMVLDSKGRLVCSTVSDKSDLLIYNRDGKLLDAWRHDLAEPHGLSLAGEGSDQTYWLTDSVAGRVVQLSLDGKIIAELPAPPADALGGKPYKPTETAVADNGDVYVADGYGSNFIFRYDAAGKLQQAFGGPDHFNCCHGIVVDRRTPTPTLLITSRANNEFQRWTLAGEHLQTYALPGLGVCRPVLDGPETYAAVLLTKTWWNYDGMVAVLDADLRVVSLPGGSEPPAGAADFREVTPVGQVFMNPHDVCVDGDKNLYVPQWYSGRTYPIRLRRV